MEEQGLRVDGLQSGKLLAQELQGTLHFGLSFGIRVAWGNRFRRQGSFGLKEPTFCALAAECVERDVASDGSRPGAEAAASLVPILCQRLEQLFKHGLYEIIMIGATAPEDPIEGRLNRSDDMIVQEISPAWLALFYGVEYLGARLGVGRLSLFS